MNEPEPAAEQSTFLGVDLNVSGSVAGTSTGVVVGSPDSLNHLRERDARKRGSLQQAGARGVHRAMGCLGSHFTQ